MTLTQLTLAALTTIAAVSAGRVRRDTPPMGWNSYNTYDCTPTEQIVQQNAQGLVDTGLAELGYRAVTIDCGWNGQYRDDDGKMQWNTTLFPSGGKAMGDFIHGLGLEFGMYSVAGLLQCGSQVIPGSLGFEDIDAQSFAEWGGDALKYDNCYPDNRDTMIDYYGDIAISPSRFQTMGDSIDKVNRDIKYYLCQWGVGSNVGVWASEIANTWRMSTDIYGAWRSVWRITNEVIPYYEHIKPGAFSDMDVLEVGFGTMSEEEERSHFGLWAIMKSPLVISCAINSSIPASSLKILSNKEIIAINQDSLGKQAQLVRRYTEEGYDIYLGELSDSRRVLALMNWKNEQSTASIDLASLGIRSADARDVWAGQDIGSIQGLFSADLAMHQLKIYVLSNFTLVDLPKSSGYYSSTDAETSGSALIAKCDAGQCLPVGSKIRFLSHQGTPATVKGVYASSSGKKLLGIDFINYDLAFDTAWFRGDNTRNMTIAVNDYLPKRWQFPISGCNWTKTGRLMVEVDGFVGGDNTVTFGVPDGSIWAPDLVGFEVFE